MVKNWERWALIVLETLYVLCAISVILYRMRGIFDFDLFSYRSFNIVISILIGLYIIYALFIRSEKYLYPIVVLFSLFHFVEGIIISFWYKVVIHLMILLIAMWIYYTRDIKTAPLG